LRTWKVSRNDFMPRAPITLRRITSHSAGFTIHGFPGYPMGSPLPSIIQVLDGKAPANTDPVRVVRRPGREIRYSGGGVTVEQLVLMDVTGKAFPDIMRELVLDPLGMKRSSFQQPLPEKLSDNAARAHGLTGRPIGVRWHVYPEMAAAGLWTTATDLARFAITVRDAALGRRQEIASARFARAMLTPSGLGQERNDYGVGFRIAGRGSNLFFGHSGANRGYQADLILFLDSGAGAAIMTNSDRGRGLIDEILATLDHVYAWPGDTFAPKPRFVGQVSDKQLERFTGAYRMRFAFGGSAEIFVQDAEPYLNVDLGPLGDSVFLPESENRLFSDDLDLDLEFVDTDVVLSVGSRVIGHGTRTEP
ncbi:MAG: serine hydrolase domain-containing protein, partial [Woeseiaceae bacterium]